MRKIYPTIEQRLWSKVDESGDCLVFQGTRNSNGYGFVCFNRKRILAHRVAYTTTYGEIPEGLFVLHRCDNPSCVNPSHLFLGTNLDNTLDRMDKGRPAGRKPEDTCKRGHELTGKNLIIPTHGKRRCRTCHNMIALACYHRKKKLVPQVIH